MKKTKPSRNPGTLAGMAASIAIAAGIAATSLPGPAFAAEIAVYKSPWCGCCEGWVEHMRANGHTVRTENLEDLDPIKKMAGVPERLQSCHTAMVDGYVIEGHVPAEDVARLLAERPKARGLAAPGMPAGSPGMEGSAPAPYTVMIFQPDGTASVYAKH